MARFNEILIGRWNRYLQKLLSMKGGPPSPQLASEISATFEIEQPSVEDRVLLGWNSYAVFFNPAASVGNTSGAQIRNPAGSNVVAVINKITLFASGVTGVTISQASTTPDLATARVGFRRDARTGAQGSTCVTTQANAVTAFAGQSIQNHTIQAGGAEVEAIFPGNQEWPLLPGDTLRISTDALNVALVVNLIWFERALEESERA
jgi:hypothetical protein